MERPGPTRLRCEYFTDPTGIEDARPRLSWESRDPRRGAVQTAYQILVDDLWDSGKVESDQSIHVEYDGPTLRSRQQCVWHVRTWDADAVPTDWGGPAVFEMGLLDRSDWVGRWIGSPIVGGPYSIPPAPYLRRSFLASSAVKRARLYVTALGLHECEINGRRVGD